ncbi:MAG: fibronectin type III domain-containing protein [Candidatus Cloacimonetes bacterium]|nr:fibronectin type III domain-containing protein [Candidatus Cloacimonadota bacterium]
MNISKMPDKDLGPYCENFNNVADENKVVLKLSDEEIIKFIEKATDFKSKLSESVAAQIAAAEAVVAKNLSREDLTVFYKGHIAKFQVDNEIPDTLRASLGITIRDKIPSHVPAYKPEDLKAEGKASGTIVLDWKAGQNKQNTLYIIESRHADQPDFVRVDMVTATKYNHKNQTPGKFVTYRIIARRGDEYSEPSNEASVYTAEL